MSQKTKAPHPPLAWMWWIPSIAWAAIIFYLSTKTGDDLPKFDFPCLDKIVHFVLYGVLSLFIFCALRFASGLRFRNAALIAVVIASLYGTSDEFHQRFTAHRSSDIRDWYADTLGASTVFLVAFLRPKGPPPI